MSSEQGFARLVVSGNSKNREGLTKSEFLKAIRKEKIGNFDNILGTTLFEYLD